ncbi:MAG: hypothetical protein MI919_19185 [Holophagales bacterium]|nr:hypothetical protein [Holophagales bacterium]
MMQRAALFFALLTLCAGLPLGPGWAREMPMAVASSADGAAPAAAGEAATESDEGAAPKLRAPVEHRAESPARTIRIEAPERSLVDTRALAATAPPTATPRRAGLPTVGEHVPLDRAPAPARHLELCVFLC